MTCTHPCPPRMRLRNRCSAPHPCLCPRGLGERGGPRTPRGLEGSCPWEHGHQRAGGGPAALAGWLRWPPSTCSTQGQRRQISPPRCPVLMRPRQLPPAATPAAFAGVAVVAAGTWGLGHGVPGWASWVEQTWAQEPVPWTLGRLLRCCLQAGCSATRSTRQGLLGCADQWPAAQASVCAGPLLPLLNACLLMQL